MLLKLAETALLRVTGDGLAACSTTELDLVTAKRFKRHQGELGGICLLTRTFSDRETEHENDLKPIY